VSSKKIAYGILSHKSKILAVARPFGLAEKIILKSSENESGETNSTQNTKLDFSLKSNKFTTKPRRSPPSLPHMIIGIEICSWLTPNLGNTNEIREMARSHIPLGSYL
jgi:hypothetical protein